MSDLNRSRTETNIDFKKLPDLVKEWKEVLLSVVAAITSIVTALGFKATGASLWIALATGAALFVGGAYFYRRTKRRHDLQRKRDVAREAFKTKRQQRMAFRGLYPYQEGDTLPGTQRQREALTIFTQITDRDFSFGVLCGDSGCGKTSLLRSALQTHLKEHGQLSNYRVLYLSSPRELSAKTKPAPNEKIDLNVKLRSELKTLEQMVALTGEEWPLVLIIDQFEEFFIEYRGELRTAIGTCLNDLINTKTGTRILCALRRDYLVDMRDLAPQLREPISIKTLFAIKNLTVKQAVNIIRECAEMDEIELDEGLAETLAEELADGGEVRPPELQIVCTALVGNPTWAEYRLSGGARGILSNYIQNAIAICGDPKIGSQLLRSLCDFPAHAKRNPQTVEALGHVVTPPAGMKDEQLFDLIGHILAQFETDRLVLIDMRSEPAYTLIHDYLVDAVAAATSDVSTRKEEANQFLQYYLSQSRSDNKIRIPFRRTRFIQKFADPTATRELQAKRLLRRSRNASLRYAAALCGVVLTFTAVLVFVSNTSSEWKLTEIGRHPLSVEARFEIQALSGGESLLTITHGEDLRLWEPKTAKLLYDHKGEARFNTSGPFILLQSKSRDYLNALHVRSIQVYETPLKSDLEIPLTFSNSGTTFAYFEGRIRSSDYGQTYRHGVVRVWSIVDRKHLGEIIGSNFGPTRSHLMSAADRLIMDCRRGDNNVPYLPCLWNVTTGKLITYLVPDKPSLVNYYVVDEDRGKIVTAHAQSDYRAIVRLWNSRTGEYREREFEGALGEGYLEPSFSHDGQFIILTARIGKPHLLAIWNTSDLLGVTEGPPSERSLIEKKGSKVYAVWEHPEGTYVWLIAKDSKPVLLSELRARLQEKEGENEAQLSLKLSLQGDRLVSIETSKVQLFDLINSKKLKDVQASTTIKGFRFTLDGGAFALTLEGGLIEIYSLADGNRIAELRNVGGDEVEIFYDQSCQRAHVWTNEGRVLRYTKGHSILGKSFWPQVRCGN